jgi:uncharacterized damage-inducible protein DinB
MAINQGFIAEMREESGATRKMLERIPADKFDWKPHEKSMSMGQLSVLVADMFGWLSFMIDEEELDFAKGYEQPKPASTDELIGFFDKQLESGLTSLKNADDPVFSERWTLRNGDQVYMETSKLDVVRQTINHMVHHRGQLSVYLRLNDIPVPPIYGPSADEGKM